MLSDSGISLLTSMAFNESNDNNSHLIKHPQKLNSCPQRNFLCNTPWVSRHALAALRSALGGGFAAVAPAA